MYIFITIGIEKKIYYGEELNEEIEKFTNFLKDDYAFTNNPNPIEEFYHSATRYHIGYDNKYKNVFAPNYILYNENGAVIFVKEFKNKYHQYCCLKKLYEEYKINFYKLKDYEKTIYEGARRYCVWYENK